MIGSIVKQLTKNATPEQMREAGLDATYVDHGLGIYPSGAAGVPFNAFCLQSKGDPITDLYENMAAEEKANRHTQDKNKPAHFLEISEITHKKSTAVHIFEFTVLFFKLYFLLHQFTTFK